jgi:Putative Ig domain
MPSRFWRAAAILAPLVLASLGAAASATAATTSNPSLITSDFACSNGVCEVGPGNVGLAFGAELNGTGGPAYYGPDCTYVISVVSGSLPPGLQLGGVCGNIISGPPAQAGTYPFTVQVQSQPNSLGQPGPSGTQPLTITIGTGKSDRLLVGGAGYNEHTKTLAVVGYDANSGALYTLSVTSTGKVVIPAKSAAGDDGGLPLSAGPGFNWPCPGESTCNLTVSDSLGGSATVTVPPAKY